MGPLGLLTVVAIFIGFGPLGGSAPDENASGVNVAAYYNAHVNKEWASIYVVGLGLALFVLFVSQLRGVLRDAGGDHTFFPNAAFAAGVLLVAGIVVSGVFQLVLIVASHNHEFAIVKVANFISQNDELGIIFGIALLTLTSGAAILTNRATAIAPLPKTLGWWSILVGVVACAGPVGFFAFIFGFPIWLIATGFVITVKARRSAKALPAELANSNLA